MSADDAQLVRAFERELLALRQGGQALGTAQPQLAHALTYAAADADVERLLAGFAYLTARTRVHLERCAPDFVLDLLRLMAPELGEPQPARTLVAVRAEQLGQRCLRTLPRGHAFEFAGAQGPVTLCTQRPTTLWPWRQITSRWQVPRDGRVVWTLRLDGPVAGLFEGHDTAVLELFLQRPFSEVAEVLLALSCHVSQLSVRLGALKPVALPPDAIGPSRLGTYAQPQPQRPNALPPGLRHLRHFYQLPHNIAFFGLQLGALRRALGAQIARARQEQGCEVTIVMDHAPQLPTQLAHDAVHANVVAVENSVACDAMPVCVNALAEPRPLRAEGFAQERSQVLRIAEAVLLAPHTGARIPIEPASLAPHSGYAYQLMHHASAKDGWHDAQVAVVGSQPLAAGHVLSARVQVSQRHAAMALTPLALAIGSLEMMPLQAQLVAPIGPPQDVVLCARHAAHTGLWRLVGLLPGRGQQRLCVDELTALFGAAVQVAQADEIGRQMLLRHQRSMVGLQEHRATRLLRGALLPLRRIALEVDAEVAGGVGEAFCVAALIDNLLADGQGLGDLQQLTMCSKQPPQRYALRVRSHHEVFGS